MKLDKEFKQDVDSTFKETDYIGKKIGIRIFLVVIVVVCLSALGGVTYKKWRVDKDREIFKQSVTYNEQAVSFLAESFRQYNLAEDEIEKNSIMQYVVLRYPNLDVETIENSTLSQFYKKCLTGGN